VGFRNAEAEALGLGSELCQRHAEGVAWDDMAILYRGNALSRGFEEALMRARVPHVFVGDVGF
jgi:DNA helicase-2/ATP-dependent DNA helicase PcrA